MPGGGGGRVPAFTAAATASAISFSDFFCAVSLASRSRRGPNDL